MEYRALFLALAVLTSAPAAESESGAVTERAAREQDPAAVAFVVGGIVPKEASYRPLNGKERWRLFLNESFAFKGGAYFRAFGAALPDHLNNRPEDWGQGSDGYFARAGDRFTRFTLSTAFGHLGAAATGLEPRYVRSKADGFGKRFLHASQLAVLTYDREGKKTFYWSRFAGAFAGEAISASWNPAVRWEVRGYQGAAQQVAAAWLFNIIREFSPDIKRLFVRPKTQ